MSKPMKFCEHVGCHELVPYDVTYCDKHQHVQRPKRRTRKRTKEHNKKVYRQRMERSKQAEHDYNRFYKTAAWRHLSHAMLVQHPICQSCHEKGIIKMANLVDHIVPIREDWSKRLDPNNLQTLCYACHTEKTKEDHAREFNKKLLK